MTKRIEVERWDWSDEEGPARLRSELSGRGLSRIRMPDAASQKPEALFGRLFREDRTLLRFSRLVVAPRPGERSIVGTDGYGPPHIDDDEFLPANVQMLACVEQAEQGGEGFYIDSWALLDEIEASDPTLYGALFDIPRVFVYSRATPLRPTFSLRYGSLICSQAPSVTEGDEVGRMFQEWVERAPRYEFRPEPGDICLINHQRMMHGRRAFRGRREYVRLLYWFVEPFQSPARHRERAEQFAARLSSLNQQGPAWVREFLQPSAASEAALPRLAAVLAHLRGESAEDLANRYDVRGHDIQRWVTRVMSLAAVHLSDEALDEDKNAADLEERVDAIIDGLLSPQG